MDSNSRTGEQSIVRRQISVAHEVLTLKQNILSFVLSLDRDIGDGTLRYNVLQLSLWQLRLGQMDSWISRFGYHLHKNEKICFSSE